MTINDIGTQHFLKRLMDTYNDEEIGIKTRRQQKLITIEEVAKELQDYLNTHEDPDVEKVDLITGKKTRISYLENIKITKVTDLDTGKEEIVSTTYLNKYNVSVNQEMTIESNYPVYKLSYNDDFEINWSPRKSYEDEKDTLDPYIFVNIHEDSIFNQMPILIFSKNLVPDLSPYDFERIFSNLHIEEPEEDEPEEIFCLHHEMLNLPIEKQKFLKVKWFREYDNNQYASENDITRVNPSPVYFSYKGMYKLTFLDGKVDVKDLQLFFNEDMKFNFDIKFSG